jgi:hypothetical protein
MRLVFLKKLLPHLLAILLFLLIAIIYCMPVFQGKVVDQHDIQGWQGMAQQSFEFKAKYGFMPYWTNSMFGGMPAYQIAFETPNKFPIQNIHNYLFTLNLPKPASFFFLACLMMYFLLIITRVNTLIGIMGAIAYAYATYDPIIVAVGHDTKMICIGYAPAVLGSLLLIFKRAYFSGTILLALFTALILSFNHFQIIYYTFIIAIIVTAFFIIHYVQVHDWRHIFISGSLAILAGVVAVGVNTASIWPTKEFAYETMRGGRSELTNGGNQSNKSAGGLDKDYAFGWSYGISETFTLLVPGIYGGGSSGNELKPGKSIFANQLVATGMSKEYAENYADSYAYWGPQPGTSGPVYLGAVICFLFIFGMVIVKNWLKWGIITACLFALILAWGKNVAGINYFLFDHMPLYNKFRAPSMALVIPQLGFVLLACLALQEMISGTTNKVDLWKGFRVTSGIALIIFMLLGLAYTSFNYTGKYDKSLQQDLVSTRLQQIGRGQSASREVQQQAIKSTSIIINGLKTDRQVLFGKDLLRSFLLILLAGLAIGLYVKHKITASLALVILLLLSSVDLLTVGWRYLNYNSFIAKKDFESVFLPTTADINIKSDPDKYFRVFDQTADDPFSDSRASYFHNSIGGYNPAKLAHYQDIIQRQLLPGNEQVFNMLNTKYFIVRNPVTKEPEARLNKDAFGNVWFVKGLRFAANADEEMNLLSRLHLHDSAVIDQRYTSGLKKTLVFDTAASIKLLENLNDRITYKCSSATTQFAVFSEVYYPYGWNAYIDGNKTDYCRVNYVLRGMYAPAGNHSIEFRFEPRSVILGSKISMWFSALLYIFLMVAVVCGLWKIIKEE